MIIPSSRDGLDILECTACGKRAWVERGAQKAECPHCAHVECLLDAPAAGAPKTAVKSTRRRA